MTKSVYQKGYALVTAMSIGVVALSITSAILLRISDSTGQITRREKTDNAQAVAEAVLGNTLDAFADISADQTNAAGTSKAGIYVSAFELANYLQSQDFMESSANNLNMIKITPVSTGLPSAYTDGTHFQSNHAFWTSLETVPDHSVRFWNAFRNTNPAANKLNTGSTLTSSFSLSAAKLDQLHNQAYTVYRVKKDRVEADVVVSIVPLATNVDGISDQSLHTETTLVSTYANHNDVFKLRVNAFVPRIQDYHQRHNIDVIVNRPVKRADKYSDTYSHAILSDAQIDLQNFKTSSGPCAAVSNNSPCIDNTTAGDVHSNTNITIGQQGHVQGKVTATLQANVNGDILPATDYDYGSNAGDPRNGSNVTTRVDKAQLSRSGKDRLELPTVDTDTSSVDLVPCVDLAPLDNDLVIYENCKYTGDLTINNNKRIEYRGTVHIAGDLDIKGSQRCTGTAACRIVVDGVVDIMGSANGNFNSTQESLFVVKGDGASAGTNCLDVGGTPDANGQYGSLFYVNNPNCETFVRGNSQFFGGIISKGAVRTVGNSSQYGIQRDSNMDSLDRFFIPVPMSKKDHFPTVIAWKDVH